MGMKLSDYLSDDEILRAKDVITEFHGQPLLNKDIGMPNLALLVIYMISNKNKANSVTEDDAATLFTSTGCGTENDFNKILYELTSRAKTPLLVRKDGILSLTFTGVIRAKDILTGGI